MDKDFVVFYSIIGSILVALVTIIGNVIITIIGKRNEFKQAQFKTIIECAWKEYEYKSNQVISLCNKSGTSGNLVPFIEYLIFYSSFLRIFGKKHVKERHIINSLKNSKEITEYYYKYQKEYKVDGKIRM